MTVAGTLKVIVGELPAGTSPPDPKDQKFNLGFTTGESKVIVYVPANSN